MGDGLWQHAVWVGLLMGGVTLAVQAGAIEVGWHWQTMVFTVLAFLQLAHAMAVRSERASTFRLGFGTNRPLLITVVVTAIIQLAFIYVPFLQPIFETEALGLRGAARGGARDAHPLHRRGDREVALPAPRTGPIAGPGGLMGA